MRDYERHIDGIDRMCRKYGGCRVLTFRCYYDGEVGVMEHEYFCNTATARGAIGRKMYRDITNEKPREKYILCTGNRLDREYYSHDTHGVTDTGELFRYSNAPLPSL